jgi:hypothetical protein
VCQANRRKAAVGRSNPKNNFLQLAIGSSSTASVMFAAETHVQAVPCSFQTPIAAPNGPKLMWSLVGTLNSLPKAVLSLNGRKLERLAIRLI